MVPARVNAKVTKLAKASDVDTVGSPLETYTGGASAVVVDVYFEVQSATTGEPHLGDRSMQTGIMLVPPGQAFVVSDRFEFDSLTYEVTGVRDVRDATGNVRHREVAWKEVQE